MSKINFNEGDAYFDDPDEIYDDDSETEDSKGDKSKLRVRRKIELLNERRKMKEMFDSDESYWG